MKLSGGLPHSTRTLPCCKTDFSVPAGGIPLHAAGGSLFWYDHFPPVLHGLAVFYKCRKVCSCNKKADNAADKIIEKKIFKIWKNSPANNSLTLADFGIPGCFYILPHVRHLAFGHRCVSHFYRKLSAIFQAIPDFLPGGQSFRMQPKNAQEQP